MTTTTEEMRELAGRLPQHLAPNERVALQALVERLNQLYGDDLLRVVLFGSKARGDFDDESDVDVLVVARIPAADYWTHRDQISEIAYELELEHDLVFSLLVMDEPGYDEMNRVNLLINRNINQDGIELWSLKLNRPTSESA